MRIRVPFPRFSLPSSLAWGRECALCLRPMDRKGYVCNRCLASLPAVDQRCLCARCPRTIAGSDGRILCGECSDEHPPAFDVATSACRFEGDMRRLVIDYKYNGRIHLAVDIADLMIVAAKDRFDVSAVDVVLPVCSTLWHRLVRGYNQCDYLAKFVAGGLGVPCMVRVLGRAGFPRRQAGLRAAERWQNVKGTFKCRRGRERDVAGKTVLVVDDVFTTGATLSACASALKTAGAKRVWCLTAAKA